MTVYNMSFVNGTGGPVGLVTGISTAVGGVVGTGICIIVYFVIIKASLDNNYDLPVALLTSSFILSILSGILFGLGWIPDWLLGINVAILVTALFMKIFGSKN
jgi:hypothetical protein